LNLHRRENIKSPTRLTFTAPCATNLSENNERITNFKSLRKKTGFLLVMPKFI
jgi:hypothetical protein